MWKGLWSNAPPRWTLTGVAVCPQSTGRTSLGHKAEKPGHVSAVTPLTSACWGGTWSVCLSSTTAAADGRKMWGRGSELGGEGVGSLADFGRKRVADAA